jgi:hypothetical protein
VEDLIGKLRRIKASTAVGIDKIKKVHLMKGSGLPTSHKICNFLMMKWNYLA